MSVRALMSLSLALGPLSGPALIAPEAFDRGDWIAVCDNTLRCSVMGLAPDGAGRAYVSLSRDGEPASAAELKIVVYSDANIPSGPVRLRAPGMDVEVPGRWSDDEIVAETKDPQVLAAFVRALDEDARGLDITIQSTAVHLSLAGAPAALGWMDERQGRAGTASALVRKGPRSAAALPPAPTPPAFVAAPKGSAVEIKPVSLPKGLLARPELRACDREELLSTDARAAWRLGPDLVLWSVPCTLGAYNLRSVFFLSDARAGSIRPAPIPEVDAPAGEAGESPPASLLNADFDPKTMTLNAFAKTRGLGDCGVLDRFLWDGRSFEPVEIDYMPECRGVTPEGWPAIYRGRVR